VIRAWSTPFFGDELAGFMTLLADAVVLETKERKRLFSGCRHS